MSEPIPAPLLTEEGARQIERAWEAVTGGESGWKTLEHASFPYGARFVCAHEKDGFQAELTVQHKASTRDPRARKAGPMTVSVRSERPDPRVERLLAGLCKQITAQTTEETWTTPNTLLAPEPAPVPPSPPPVGDPEAALDRWLADNVCVDVSVPFDPAPLLEEARALLDQFVPYQSDPTYGIKHWRSLGLRAFDGDWRSSAMAETIAEVNDDTRYRNTEMADRCPQIMAFAETLVDVTRCRSITLLALDPRTHIAPHRDGEGPHVMRSVNVALNMPEGCVFRTDLSDTGEATERTRTLPFKPGTALLIDVSRMHDVINDSDELRIHLVIRGPLRKSAEEVLALAQGAAPSA